MIRVAKVITSIFIAHKSTSPFVFSRHPLLPTSSINLNPWVAVWVFVYIILLTGLPIDPGGRLDTSFVAMASGYTLAEQAYVKELGWLILERVEMYRHIYVTFYPLVFPIATPFSKAGRI